MSSLRYLVAIAAGVVLFVLPAREATPVGMPAVHASTTCTFTVSGSTMTLDGDCTTDATLIIPDGFTLDGNGHTITAVDPPGSFFKGAVVQNAGATAYVRSLKIAGSFTASVCGRSSPVDQRLRGILFQGASGSVTRSVVTGIRRGPAGLGCQEGNGIEVRNTPFDGTHPNTKSVAIVRNEVTGYQKTGIVANGDVSVSIINSDVGSANLPKRIAANSMQIGFGAAGTVNNNAITGNQWDVASSPQWAATAVLVYLAGDVNVNHNTITGVGTDVGVIAQNAGTVNVMNNTITRSLASGDTVDAYGIGVSFYANDGKSKVVSNTFSGWNVAFEGADLARANEVLP